MRGATPNSRREGPARARALARQRAAEGPHSATAWLEGSHAAIVLHPEWQQARVVPYDPRTDLVRVDKNNGCVWVPLCVLRLKPIHGARGEETQVATSAKLDRTLHTRHL